MALVPIVRERCAEAGRALDHPVVQAVLVGLLSLTLNLLGNGEVSLWDRDEPRYATCAREMRASGDFIHPTFNAEPRYHKPVLIYWLMLIGTAIGGDNPFGARLVSSVAGAATVLLVLHLGSRMFSRRVGLWSSLILATTPLFIAESKLSTTDSTLALMVVACQYALWELARRSSKAVAAAFWGVLGLAILTKAPAAPVLIGAAAAASWWWGGPTSYIKRLEWKWGPALCALIALPWFAAIMIVSKGAYYDVGIGYHVLRRATNGIEEHGGFPGYYVLVSLVTCHPWSAFVPAALFAAWRKRRESSNFGFLLGWVLGPLVLLECVRTKLIHYYLPSIPAIALALGWFASELVESRTLLRKVSLGRLASGLSAGIGLSAAVAVLAATFVVPAPLVVPCLLSGIVLAAGTLAATYLHHNGDSPRALIASLSSSALLMAIAAGVLLPSAEPYRISTTVGRRLAAWEKRESAAPVLGNFMPPAAVYALGHPAPVARNLAMMLEQIEAKGSIVTALQDYELRKYEKDSRVSLEVREVVSGFNIDKGRKETLHVAVLRSPESRVASTKEQPVK